MVLIIDGDFIPYRVGYSIDADATFEQAKSKTDDLLKQLIEIAGTNEYIGYLGGKNNFRYKLIESLPKELMTPIYKGNRSSEKPPFFYEIRDYLKNNYGFYTIDGIEADDACAITLTNLKSNGLLLSTDKDVLQVPGYHIQLKPSGAEHIEVTEEGTLALSENRKKVIGTGYKLLWSQMLTGDGVDNFIGVPKCGPVKAVSLLENESSKTIPKIVYNEFKNAYKEHAEVMYKFTWNLAYMLRFHSSLSTIPKSKLF